MRVARIVNCAFEPTSGVAATMAMHFAGKNGLLLLPTIVDCAQNVTSHE
jgi:hypothetical protein